MGVGRLRIAIVTNDLFIGRLGIAIIKKGVGHLRTSLLLSITFFHRLYLHIAIVKYCLFYIYKYSCDTQMAFDIICKYDVYGEVRLYFEKYF